MPWEKQFDEDVALERAMRAFWARGFEATSMSDLVETTGVNRASLYATFGDKRQLFLRALTRYDQQHRKAWFARLEERHEPREAILRAFEEVVERASSGDRDGCFVVNTALELAPHDPRVRARVRSALTAAEAFFERMLRRAGHPRAAELAPVLLGLFLGLRVLSRSRPEKRLFDATLAQVRDLLR